MTRFCGRQLRRATPVFLLAALVVSACGGSSTPVVTQLPTTAPTAFVPTPTPSPSPAAASCLSPPAAASTLTGLGATLAVWNSHHQADPSIQMAYNHMSGAYPGASLQDQFQGVTVMNGVVAEYFEQLPPNTSAAQASAIVAMGLPTDQCALNVTANLGICGGQYFQSASLATLESTGGSPGPGVISVSYTSSYNALSSEPFNPNDVELAFVSESPGLATLPFPPEGSGLASAFCGG
jgi:hypothetical protein